MNAVSDSAACFLAADAVAAAFGAAAAAAAAAEASGAPVPAATAGTLDFCRARLHQANVTAAGLCQQMQCPILPVALPWLLLLPLALLLLLLQELPQLPYLLQQQAL
jgi:hypothetical protein